MKILIVGGGAREHALGWKFKKDHPAFSLTFMPGNAGTVEIGENSSNGYAPLDLAKKLKPDLVVIGPEAPLAQGLADELKDKGFKAFGPSRAAARLESSKIFAKDFCARNKIPTAKYGVFDRFDEAFGFIRSSPLPLVIKADGLAQGKGVKIVHTLGEAEAALRFFIDEGGLGVAGRRVVIEEFLEGRELSLMAFFDGQSFVYLPPARDYKRLLDADQGPNTGGMGSVAPVMNEPRFWSAVESDITAPWRRALEQEGLLYQGVIYFGLMLTKKGIKVLEFNARFGDPETQVLMPLVQVPLIELMEAVCEGLLGKFPKDILLRSLAVGHKERDAVGVSLASQGYPDHPKTGSVIEGLDLAARRPGVEVFHAGTAKESGRLVSSGGRVLSVVGLGINSREARSRAYGAVSVIKFEGMQYRKDIGM
ncbi:MAG: phosphoribosylamine--glycine ligase [Elusimicrobiota bacterium]